MAQTDRQNRLNWVQILISASLTALLSLVVSIVVFNYTHDKPKLIYEIFPISSFVSDKTELGIYNVQILNDGSKEAEEITCDFNFAKGTKIIESKIEPSSSAISYNTINDSIKNKLTYKFPMLNPSENCKFSFLIENFKETELHLSLRAKGIIGVLRNTSENDKDFSEKDSKIIILVLPMLMIMVVLMSGLLFVFIRSRGWFEGSKETNIHPQINVAVDYCDMGLFEESISLLKKCIYKNSIISSSHSNLARAYANTKEFDKAFMELEIAKRTISNDVDKLVFLYVSAQVYALKNDKIESIKFLRQAIEINKKECIEKAKIDDDFNNIRNEKEFIQLISDIK